MQDYHEWFDGECGIVLRKNADGIWGMTSEGLGKIANASDADSMATDLLRIMHGIVTIVTGGPYPIKIKEMRVYDAKKDEFQVACDISCTVYVVKPQVQDTKQRISAITKQVFKSHKCGEETLRRCLTILSNGQPNLYDGYKIYELIEEDCKNITQKKSGQNALKEANLITDGERRIMTYNMNSYTLQGEAARHAGDDAKDIAKYKVQYQYVQKLVMKLVEKWLEYRRKQRSFDTKVVAER